MTSQGSTYAGQQSLPRLPIPTLEETLERFPSTVSALLSTSSSSSNDDNKEMKECLDEVQQFLTTDGPKLQKLLIEYDEKGKEEGNVGSFIEEFWTDAYLAPDSSVVMNLESPRWYCFVVTCSVFDMKSQRFDCFK